MRSAATMTTAGTIAGTILSTVWLSCAMSCSTGMAMPRDDVDARPVELSEFARPASEEPPAGDDATAAAGQVGGDDANAPVVWFDDFGERDVLNPAVPGETVVVDSLVGYVNGRPIFADAFLQPIEDRLLRAAEQYRGVDLERTFMTIINEWLQEIVLNELIIAESAASLTEQEQMGLFALLNRVYDEEIRKGGGTRSGAEKRRAREGEELDQYLGTQKDLVLIDRIRAEKIWPRVFVSWRDIEREYQRLYEDFNPPATVTLARLRLTTATQGPLIEDVTKRLAAGESFESIATELGYDDGGLWDTFPLGAGGITDIQDVSPVMKEALAGLQQGDTTKPFELGSSTYWLHVVALEQPEAHSLYDPGVQLRLRNALLAQRRQLEWNRYIDSLLEEGIHDDLEAMADRLYRIAMNRYGP